jgi:hypothetical protein
MPEPMLTFVRSGSAAVALTVAAGLTPVSCSSDSDDTGTPSTARPTAPDTASFSGTPPTALKPDAASAVESARAAAAASYAVQVDFLDDSGKVVEPRYVGAEDLEPGEKAQPLAVSRKPTEPVLTPKGAKAQRY